MKQEILKQISKLVNKKYVVFTKRGNFSIKAVTKLIKHLGYNEVCIQDMGGWMTYPQFIEKAKLSEKRLKTNYGLLDEVPENSVLLINSMPGYMAYQDMKKIAKDCNEKNTFLINDVAGSIGTDDAKYGDIIIGSFGRWKPLNVEDGGFVATDNEEHYTFLKEFEEEIDLDKLKLKLDDMDNRVAKLRAIVEDVKNDLSEFDIVHKDQTGLVVVVKFNSDSEREKLIKYATDNNYEWVECPMYIRILEPAISIEVKRLN